MKQQQEYSDSDSGVMEDLPHQANYYRESSDHRCVQHGIALVFWSKIVLDTSKEDDIDNNIHTMGLYGNEEEQQQLIADCFVRKFYDSSVKRWTTVSKSQGGGGIRWFSASAASQTLGLPEDAEDTPYYRVVDQAIAVLACLEQIRVLDNSNTITQTGRRNSRAAIMMILLPPTTTFGIAATMPWRTPFDETWIVPNPRKTDSGILSRASR